MITMIPLYQMIMTAQQVTDTSDKDEPDVAFVDLLNIIDFTVYDVIAN